MCLSALWFSFLRSITKTPFRIHLQGGNCHLSEEHKNMRDISQIQTLLQAKFSWENYNNTVIFIERKSGKGNKIIDI